MTYKTRIEWAQHVNHWSAGTRTRLEWKQRNKGNKGRNGLIGFGSTQMDREWDRGFAGQARQSKET